MKSIEKIDSYRTHKDVEATVTSFSEIEKVPKVDLPTVVHGLKIA